MRNRIIGMGRGLALAVLLGLAAFVVAGCGTEETAVATSGGENEESAGEQGVEEGTEEAVGEEESTDSQLEGGEGKPEGADSTTEEGDEAADEEETTGGDEETTGGDEETTGGDEETTGGDEETTGGDEETTGGDEETTGGEEQTTAGEEETTGGEEETTGGEEGLKTIYETAAAAGNFTTLVAALDLSGLDAALKGQVSEEEPTGEFPLYCPFSGDDALAGEGQPCFDGLTYEGCCADGVLTWCEGGVVATQDCAVQPGSGSTCGTWSEANAYYVCIAPAIDFTVFAPTDAAFDALPEGTLDDILANEQVLTALLTYHLIVDASELAADAVAAGVLLTALDENLTVENIDGEVVINGVATVTTKDVMCTNGVIHIIDAVLDFPEYACGDGVCGPAEFDCVSDCGCPAGQYLDDLGECIDAPEDSCVGGCGGFAVNGTCDCSSSCFVFDDCCEDICDVCGEDFVFECEAPSKPNIVDTLASLGNHTTLLTAASEAGLAETLGGEELLTVFAPTDAAFEAMGDELTAILGEADGLKNVLMYHVLSGLVDSSEALDLVDLGLDAFSLNNFPLTLTLEEGELMINGEAKVEVKDILCSNGYIHVIDVVLTPPASECGDEVCNGLEDSSGCPLDCGCDGEGEYYNADSNSCELAPVKSCIGGCGSAGVNQGDDDTLDTCWCDSLCFGYDDCCEDVCDACGDDYAEECVLFGQPNIVDTLTAQGNHTTLLALVTEAGLDTTLSEEGNFTVLAPTDDAIAALGDETIGALYADLDLLTDTLLYHVLSGVVDSTEATAAAEAGEQVSTLNGLPVSLSLDGDSLMINGVAKVTTADLICGNGYIHVIDTVLTMPDPVCGDGVCNGDDDSASCAQDCGCESEIDYYDAGSDACVTAPADSCLGGCEGGLALNGTCGCDDFCFLFGDCCDDICDVCTDLDDCE